MIELAKHIEILLLDNDCVIVPDFGGFMAHHVDAVYDEEEGLFLPPRRTLGFNPQLYINDSLLAQSYVEAYDISYPDAMNRIESEVREIRQTLANEGYYELPDIGVITNNSEGNYEFEPCLSGILTPDIYALTSFEMPLLQVVKSKSRADSQTEEISKQASRKMNARKKNGKLVAFSESSDEDELITDIENGSDEEQTATILSLNPVLFRNIAAAAAILVFIIFSAMPFGDAVPTTVQQCSIDSNILMKMMPQVQVTKPETIELSSMADNLETEMEQTVKEESKPEVKPEEKKDSYVLVFACRIPLENAEKLALKLRNQGLSDARTVQGYGGAQVVYGSFTSEMEAYQESKRLRQLSSQYDDVWILKLN